jgi:LacI family transcriptional regulator
VPLMSEKSTVAERRCTIADVALAACVSVPTVSKVLNNQNGVAKATRERVQQVIVELGYVSSRAARSLRNGQTGVVDLVVLRLDSPYIFEIIAGVEEGLSRAGLRMALTVTHDKLQRERRWLETVIDRATDGAILVLAHGQSDRLDALAQHGVPFVVVDHRGGLGAQVPSVGATNWAGARSATEYLLSLGHRRIALISGPPSYECSHDREEGYRAALQAAGLPVHPAYIRPGEFVYDTGLVETTALLDLPEPPTAVFAGSDLQAMGVYAAARARGLLVPHDLSVVGFDDVPMSATANPPLTTVRQPLADMGLVATSMLLRLLNDEPLDSMGMVLPTSLVYRDSCAPPREG